MKVPIGLMFFFAIFFSTISISQSSFKKKYFVPESVSKPDDTNARESYLYQGTYNSSNSTFKNIIKYNFDSAGYYKKRVFWYSRKPKRRKWKGRGRYIRANVKHSGKYLLVNPFVNNDILYRDSSFAFKMINREAIKLSYRQWTVTPISVPLKAQFGKDNRTNFSSDVSLGGMIGYSLGRTRFLYRNNLDNFKRSHEFTLGLAFSFEGIEIERDNEELDDVKTASTSVGLGFIYSYDKINFGLVGGIEFAHGFAASQWDFHERPWAGILIGYSIFD